MAVEMTREERIMAAAIIMRDGIEEMQAQQAESTAVPETMERAA